MQQVRDIYRRYKKQILIFVSLLVVVLIIILLKSHNFQQIPGQPTPSAPLNQPQPTQVQKESKVLDIPKVNFASYSIQTDYPNVPSAITTYTLKTNLTPDEIRSFAQKVGMNDIKESKTDYVTLANVVDKNKGYGLLNRNSGSFNLQMYGDQRPNSFRAGMSPQQEALVYLQELGIADESVTCPITYQRIPFTDANGYTYVECHRDWEKLGLPVYSLIGLLNVPANVPLNSLIVGRVRSDTPLDKSVTNINTGQNGYARPNDFNTATIGIRKDGAIESIVSSLKWIQSRQVVAKNDILSPQEALELFKSRKALLSLTIPDGKGSVQWEKVYQNNEANADQATVTDMTLSYLERPLSEAQDSFVPMYVIRGYAVLATGYTVRFVEVMPALRSQAAYLSEGRDIQAVAGEHTKKIQGDSALQMKEFQLPTATPTLTPTPTLIPSAISTITRAPVFNNSQTTGGMSASDLVSTQQLQTINSCVPTSKNDVPISLNVPGYGKLNVYYDNSNVSLTHTFWLSSAELPSNDMAIVKDAFFKAVENQFVKNVTYRLTSDFQGSVTSLKTKDDVKNLYLAINQKDGILASGLTCFETLDYKITDVVQYSAPFYNCPAIAAQQKFDNKRFDDIANNVADRALSAIANNTLVEEGGKPDQFPQSVLHNIGWLFLEASSPDQQSCYITGSSPVLFVYPTQKEQVTIQLSKDTTFEQPSSSNNTWVVIADHNGSLEFGETLKLPYLYYEYNGGKVQFISEAGGYLVNKDNLLSWVRDDFGKQLALNAQEKKRLEQEVTNAMYGKELTDLVKVTLLRQEEVEAKLPLRISPQPDHFYRIHLVLTPALASEVITAPKLSPVDRRGFTVIELGARAEIDHFRNDL